jgi:uncharacterized protein YidB (DUF937 family)
VSAPVPLVRRSCASHCTYARQRGGLAGFAQQLQNRGLGSQVRSWIATGPNQPVTPEQVRQALGSERVRQLAAGVGLDADAVARQLSVILPQLVDRLTPNGQLPVPEK